MSENQNSGLPDLEHGPENIEAERLLLLDIQAQHAIRLEQVGIAEKARHLLPDGALNNLTSISVALLREKGRGKDVVIERPSVRFATPSIHPSGHSSTNYQYVHVAEVSDGLLLPVDDFTEEDAITVINMLAGLKEAQMHGVLQHLGSSLTDINNPNTAIGLRSVQAPSSAE